MLTLSEIDLLRQSKKETLEAIRAMAVIEAERQLGDR